MPRPGPRRVPVQVKFAPDELDELTRRAAAAGMTLSDFVRDLLPATPIPEHELVKLSDDELLTMWNTTEQVYHAQIEDKAPKGSATPQSLWGPVMNARLETVLNARGIYPAVEAQRQADRLAYEQGPQPHE